MPAKSFSEATQNEFNYTKRTTRQVGNTLDEATHNNDKTSDLIDSARTNLIQLYRTCDSREKQETIRKQGAKLDSLKPITIPMEDGTSATYYSIADNAGGVTEKTCLISEERLQKTLTKLANAEDFTALEQNKIQMNAILKHPKAGKDTEVQREAIGLKMARILEFPQVTGSTLVSHDTGSGRHPCLFVPFAENMELLTDSIDSPETMHGRLEKEKMEGVEDFGKYSAYFMLCGDPDFIGKNGQNKGLVKGEKGGKQLYIFDQVFMKESNFGMDGALNITPTNPLAKMPGSSRHYMGRNKSVINDSSYEEKVKGAIHVLKKEDEMRGMFNDIAKANEEAQGNPTVRQLRSDAASCRRSFDARVENVKALFPPVTLKGEPKRIDELLDKPGKLDLVTKAMVTNQLLSEPQGADASGKPYRAPFFSTPSTKVSGISFMEDGGVKINFSRRLGTPLSENKKTTLSKHGFVVSPDGQSATISEQELLQLNESASGPAANAAKASSASAASGARPDSPRGVESLSEAPKIVLSGPGQGMSGDPADAIHDYGQSLEASSKETIRGPEESLDQHQKTKP
nr:hypothetical protein [Gammaproteobacteria bacterium]